LGKDDWKYKGDIRFSKAVVFSKNLRLTDLKVYLVLLGHYNRVSRECFPSIRVIAEETGLTEKTVKASRNRLKQQGLINWTSDKKVKNSCMYDFPLEHGSELDQARICAKLRLGYSVPQPPRKTGGKGNRYPNGRGNGYPNPITAQSSPQTQTRQGLHPNGGRGTNYPPKYLTNINNKSYDSDNGQGSPLSKEREPDLKLSLHKKEARRLLAEVNSREPEPSEIDRVVRLLEQGLSGRQILNILKTNPEPTETSPTTLDF
jgi:DNA-binding MarR family transcriptional regulator